MTFLYFLTAFVVIFAVLFVFFSGTSQVIDSEKSKKREGLPGSISPPGSVGLPGYVRSEFRQNYIYCGYELSSISSNLAILKSLSIRGNNLDSGVYILAFPKDIQLDVSEYMQNPVVFLDFDYNRPIGKVSLIQTENKITGSIMQGKITVKIELLKDHVVSVNTRSTGDQVFRTEGNNVVFS